MNLINKKLNNDDFILKEFLDNAFLLKSHLMEFLSIEDSNLGNFLTNAKMNLANLHPGSTLSDASDFYEEIVGDKHIADLAAWHISSKDYIADTLRLQQRFSREWFRFWRWNWNSCFANAMSSKVGMFFL